MQAPLGFGAYAQLPAFLAAAPRSGRGHDVAGREALLDCLGISDLEPVVSDLQVGTGVKRDGVRIVPLSWQLPYGPRTEGWLMTPATGAGPWPGVLAMHDHGGWRWHGKEKIADGPAGPDPALPRSAGGIRSGYDGMAWANRFAAAGFCVLVYDVFTWGSRRFAPGDLAEAEGAGGDAVLPTGGAVATAEQIDAYNRLANSREHTAAKWCALLGRSFPGLLAYEDRVAAAVLRRMAACAPGRLGCCGHSGGGTRAACLAGVEPLLGAAVISCMMTTYAALARHKAWVHTWQFIPPGWPRLGDWPDIPALGGIPLLVQYGLEDTGFSLEGMRDADAALRRARGADGYRGRFYPNDHRFTNAMQAEAMAFLGEALTVGAGS